MIARTPNAYAILAAVETEGRLELTTPGASAPNIRLPSAVHMLRALLVRRRAARSPEPGRGLFLLQFDDSTHQCLRSVAFGRPVGAAPLVELMMDPYFHYSDGFAELRTLSASGALPPWPERADTLFWRGRGSHRGVRTDGGPVTELREVPRIALALALRDHPHADVGITGPWMQRETNEEAQAFLERERVFRPHAPMAEHARFRFQIDIDGVANAWATLERFLCGSCVLKLGTPFEMWFYPLMRPWEHYVPVAADASDLPERLDWCLSHPAEAESIAAAGRALALSLTYEVAAEHALRALDRCRIPLDGGGGGSTAVR